MSNLAKYFIFPQKLHSKCLILTLYYWYWSSFAQYYIHLSRDRTWGRVLVSLRGELSLPQVQKRPSMQNSREQYSRLAQSIRKLIQAILSKRITFHNILYSTVKIVSSLFIFFKEQSLNIKISDQKISCKIPIKHFSQPSAKDLGISLSFLPHIMTTFLRFFDHLVSLKRYTFTNIENQCKRGTCIFFDAFPKEYC